MNDLVVRENKELEGIDASKAAQIKAVFEPMVKMLEEFEAQYNEVIALEISPQVCARAKRLRLDVAKVRIEADRVRKDQKEEYLRAGNAIQGVYNILKFAVTDKEEKLKEIEEYYERQEAERIAALQREREIELEKYEFDGSALRLGEMEDAIWTNFLNGTRLNYEAVKEAERKAEEERIKTDKMMEQLRGRKEVLMPYAQFGVYGKLTMFTTEEEFNALISEGKTALQKYEEEQKKIKEENERLKRENEKKEVELKQQEKKAAEEREKRERIEREQKQKELDAKREAEEKARRDAEEKRKAEAAPDKEKLLSLCKHMRGIKLNTANAQSAVDRAHKILWDYAGTL